MINAEGLQLGPESRRLDSGPLSEQVYRVLRDAILDGVFDEHTHLVQNQLADQLNVSRTPVRDALLRLAQEKLVKAIGARGYVVVVDSVTERDFLDVYEVRLTLEPSAAILALPHFGPAALDRLEALDARLCEDVLATGTAVFEVHRDFHMTVVEPCPNRLMVKILRDLWELPVTRRLFQRLLEEHRLAHERSIDHDHFTGPEHGHAAVIKAIRDRDPASLQEAVARDLIAARDQTSRFLDGRAIGLPNETFASASYAKRH